MSDQERPNKSNVRTALVMLSIAAVFFAFARGRARLGDLMRLARDSNAAFATLGRCRARLGPALGIPVAQG